MGFHRIFIGRLFLLFGIFVLVLGYNEYLKFKQELIPQSQERYWEDSGINELHLLQYLKDKRCHQSTQRFFACANLLGTMAYQIGYSYHPVKGFRRMGKDVESFHEKKLLSSWSDYLAESNSRAQRISEYSFEQQWHILRIRIPAKKRAMVLGMGINAYFSIINDPHTYLVPAKYYEEVIANANGPSLQTGIWLAKVGTKVFVKKVAEESPIAEAQIHRGDEILRVNGKNVTSLPLPQIYDLFKGLPGTEIDIEIQHPNEFLSTTVKILRKEYNYPAIKTRFVSGEKSFGYITLNKFALGTCEKLKTDLTELFEKKIKGLIIDLRDNPGGQIEEASCMASLFLGARKIFELKFLDPDAPPEEFIGKGNAIYHGPLAVLVNSGTASAAEILAGAIQDYNRGILVGGRTFGKGTFQEGDYWTHNGKLLFFETKGLFILPSGKSPQALGLDPDIVIPQKFSNETESNLYLNPLKVQGTFRAASITLNVLDEKCKSIADEKQIFEIVNYKDEDLKTAYRVLFCYNQQIGGRFWQ